jgi:hypothetical protein
MHLSYRKAATTSIFSADRSRLRHRRGPRDRIATVGELASSD